MCGVLINMIRQELKVIRLIEPDMCQSCRFGEQAIVRNVDGSIQPVIRCLRLDCDNWDTSYVEDVESDRVETEFD